MALAYSWPADPGCAWSGRGQPVEIEVLVAVPGEPSRRAVRVAATASATPSSWHRGAGASWGTAVVRASRLRLRSHGPPRFCGFTGQRRAAPARAAKLIPSESLEAVCGPWIVAGASPGCRKLPCLLMVQPAP
jgi:hypothetical protein